MSTFLHSGDWSTCGFQVNLVITYKAFILSLSLVLLLIFWRVPGPLFLLCASCHEKHTCSYLWRYQPNVPLLLPRGLGGLPFWIFRSRKMRQLPSLASRKGREESWSCLPTSSYETSFFLLGSQALTRILLRWVFLRPRLFQDQGLNSPPLIQVFMESEWSLHLAATP